MRSNNENKPEIRYDLTSGKWVVVAPKRAHKSSKKKSSIFSSRISKSKKDCPFEDPQKSGNKQPYLWYPENKKLNDWKIQVFENKYPALSHDVGISCLEYIDEGIFMKIIGRGFHDLVVTRWHDKNFPDLDSKTRFSLFRVFIRRYKEISDDECVKYVSIFQNWGASAGASVFHPHYQILSLPVIPNNINRSLEISKKYYKMHRECVHCVVIKNEISLKKRVVYENDEAVAFVPFAAREPYQVKIYPKRHNAFFEESDDKSIKAVSDALKNVLLKIRKNIGDPDYNMYIHTAPVYGKLLNKNYHWHIEVIPKSNIDAGFELSTGVEINSVEPEIAAREIRLGK